MLAGVASALIRNADAMRAGSAFGFRTVRIEIGGGAAAIEADGAGTARRGRHRAALARAQGAFSVSRARSAQAHDRPGEGAGESLQNRPARGEFARQVVEAILIHDTTPLDRDHSWYRFHNPSHSITGLFGIATISPSEWEDR